MTDVTREVDVVVLGLGPGGEHAAIKLGRAGLDVVAIEERLVGGECPYFGCVPSKMMIAAAGTLGAARRVPDFGGSATVTPDWGPVAARIRDEATDDWDDKVAVKRLEENGATFVRGRGTLTGPGRVEADGTTYVARRGVVLNTGTAPAVPPIDGLAGTPYWTNRDAVRLTELPASLVVIGGGAIGAELAQVFARFGVRVTVVEGAPRLLPLEEPEAGEALEKAFAADGIQVLTGTGVDSVAYADGTFTLVVGRAGAGRRQGARRGRAAYQPGRHRPGDGRRRPRGQGRGDRRADAGRRQALGGRRHHRQGRVHARVDVPGGRRHPRHPRRGRPVGGLPRRHPGDVHRAGGRRLRAVGGAGARAAVLGGDRHR